MGKLVVTEFMTLDGIIEDPGAEGTPHGGWSFGSPAPERQQCKFEELQASDVQLLGRVDTLRAHDLVDEYHLMMHPVVLGRGKRLFKEDAAGTRLELADSRQVGPDVLLLTYRPAR
jgi:hypothetical protein